MFGDLGKLMKAAGQLKARLPEMQEKLAKSHYTAEAGGGAVSATVNGRMKLVDLKIATEALAECNDDPELLADVIRGAVRAAQETAAAAVKEALAEITGGLEIPGLTDVLP